MKTAIIVLSCISAAAKDEASLAHEIYQGSPKTELWVGKKHMRQGSSMLESGTRNLKEKISSMKNVLKRLQEVEQHMSTSIEQAEAENQDYVNVMQGSEKRITSAIKSFEDTVNTFNDVRAKTVNNMQEGARQVSLGSFQTEDAAKQRAAIATERNAIQAASLQEQMAKRTHAAENRIQEAQEKLRKAGDGARKPLKVPSLRKNVKGGAKGPFQLTNHSNMKRVFYSGVCGGSGSSGCLRYASMLFAQHPACLHGYMEDTFPILAALRCAILKGCSGFSYALNGWNADPKAHTLQTFWSESFEYLTDVGIVKYYDRKVTCPVPPPIPAIDVSRAWYVVYAKDPEGSYIGVSPLGFLRTLSLGGGGCFSVLSQLGFFSGILPLQASGSMAVAATSSGGTWMFAMTSLRGGGLKGTKWPETWDSVQLRKEQFGSRPIWQIFYKIYNTSATEAYTHEDQEIAKTKLVKLMKCVNMTFTACDGQKRSISELKAEMGTASVCSRTSKEFKKFFSTYIGSVVGLYMTGGGLALDAGPTWPGGLGYNFMGAAWTGIVKSWLFVGNGLTQSMVTSDVGWSYVGRWVNTVTHFTKAYGGSKSKSPVVPLHRYVRAIEMVQPLAFCGPAEICTAKSVVSAVAASSNVPVQALLDIIWMVESDMCTVTHDSSMATANSKKSEKGASGVLTSIIKVLELTMYPVFAADKTLGNLLSSMNELDHQNYKSILKTNFTSDPFKNSVDAASLAEFSQTPSPLVVSIGYYLPENKGYGYAGDSATTDDAGIITALKVLDNVSPDFRPYHMLTLLTTSDPKLIQRYFLKTSTMYDTMVPLVSKADNHGLDCAKSKQVRVNNPYFVFDGSVVPSANGTVTSVSIHVGQNVYHNVKGGYGLHVVFFQLKMSAADTIFLSWLPKDLKSPLIAAGFPAYQGSRDTAHAMFATGFVKGYALFTATAYRGFLAVCNLIEGDKISGGHTTDLVKGCATQSSLNRLFHDEDVITTLLTMTPKKGNYFEPLRANVVQNMRGFAFWGLDATDSRAALSKAEEQAQ